MKLLNEEFLAQYPDAPEHMNELGTFVFYRTYSRFLEEEGRRETWKEAVQRAVEYNVGVSIDELKKKGITPPIEHIRKEAEALFDNVFNLRQFLSGRTHWVGGSSTGVANKFPLANFNCSFLNINSWGDMGDLFYLLLVGTGVGFKCSKEMAEKLPSLRKDVTIYHDEYKLKEKKKRQERSTLSETYDEAHFAKIEIGDSKEGWVEALRIFLDVLTKQKYEHIKHVVFDYNSIRPRGERLLTFGGTASGHEPLRDMFEGIHNVIQGKYAPVEKVDAFHVQLRPIHILDMGNLIGNNVVVGGVRRTAEIFLSDADDWEVILAKYGINGIWDEEKHNAVLEALQGVTELPEWLSNLPIMDANVRPLHHRRMSNNSIGFETKPSREMLNLIFTIMKAEGEPGFVNLEAAGKRRYNAEGMNPCGEIILDSYGVCNLTTVNVDAFVYPIKDISTDEHAGYELDYSALMQAQALSTRAGVRMTCLDLELPHWDEVHKRDRLIGTSLTGWQDAMEKLQYKGEQEAQLLELLSECSRMEALKYANALRIPVPLLDTTIKPEGTLSQVAGGVSSGLHVSHSPYYIRRIRINANDSLAKVAMQLGWNVNPEVGQSWENANTYVIDFPVKSGATRTKGDVGVKEQFDTYFMFQEHYTSHNSSNTIHVRDNEWELCSQIVWDRWDEFIGVSFLSYDGHTYQLAPYEEINEEQYDAMKTNMKPFDPKLLERWETSGESELTDESCIDGACSVR